MLFVIIANHCVWDGCKESHINQEKPKDCDHRGYVEPKIAEIRHPRDMNFWRDCSYPSNPLADCFWAFLTRNKLSFFCLTWWWLNIQLTMKQATMFGRKQEERNEKKIRHVPFGRLQRFWWWLFPAFCPSTISSRRTLSCCDFNCSMASCGRMKPRRGSGKGGQRKWFF